MTDDYYENTRKQIRDIRRRIEKLRKELSPPRPKAPQRNEQVLEQAPRVERTPKEKELDDIRKKLRRFK